jgi:hypothetical protein
MSTMPLDLQRRLEQRWAARCLRPSDPAATPKRPPERADQPLAAPGKSKRKTRRVEQAALGSDPAK